VTSSFGAGLSTLSTIAATLQSSTRKNTKPKHVGNCRPESWLMSKALTPNPALKFLEQAHVSADEFLQSSARQFDAGRKSWQELMNTEREKAQTLAQLAEAKTLQWLAQQRLHLLSMGVDGYLHSQVNP
jgi:adhesin transport system outer membrane protein